MNPFKRKLSLQPFDTLAAEEDENWWKDLLRLWQPSGAAGGLRLALRNNTLNFYAAGQSVAEVGLDRAKRVCVRGVHVKYATPGRLSSKSYLRFDSNGVCLTTDFSDVILEPGKTITSWVTEARNKSGPEKRFVDEIVARTPSIIDLEMGLPSLIEGILGADGRRKRPGKGSGAPRVDGVTIEGTVGGPRIVFWEVKLIDDERLVSNPLLGKSPEVVKQVRAYERFFEDEGRKMDVRNGYIETCRVLTDLLKIAERVDSQGRSLSPMVRNVLKNPQTLTIDPSPRLLIHRPGRTTASWNDHLKRLRDEFNIRCFEVTEPCDLATLPKLRQ